MLSESEPPLLVEPVFYRDELVESGLQGEENVRCDRHRIDAEEIKLFEALTTICCLDNNLVDGW